MTTTSFIEKFNAFILEQHLADPSGKILLAVSGGPDSVAMCHVFKSAGLAFGIAHCNFKLRGTDSDADAAFVEDLSQQFKVPFFSVEFDTHQYRKENKLSLEEAARHLRYQWLEDIRKQFHYTAIATAHHLNDSAETLLLHLVRGTGLRGLTGIPAKNQNIIRPLLFATRAEIMEFIAANAIIYRTDLSNNEDQFDRNKIRNNIIPMLRELNPSLEKTFSNNIRHFTEADLLLSEYLAKKITRVSFRKNNAEYIPSAFFKNHPAAVTLLHYWLSPAGFNEDQLHQMMRTIGESGKIFYSKSHRVLIDRKFLILNELKKTISDNIVIESSVKHIKAENLHLEITSTALPEHLQFNDSGKVAYFDADKVAFPLILRKWRPGDYLYPLGLTRRRSDKPGKKKVSDILTNLKLDILQKENTYVVCSGDYIIWVVGIRQDERFKITAGSKSLLKLRML